MLKPLRGASLGVLLCLFPTIVSAQETSPPPVFSIGQPPRSLIYADVLAQRSSGSLRSIQLTGGLERAITNPVVGLLVGAGEAYAAGGSSTGGEMGVRGILRSPALALGLGIDWNFTRGRADALLTYRSAILRGGLLGHGSMLRMDWLPTRNHTFALGLEIPLNRPLAGRTRPRHVDVSLPHSPRPAGLNAEQVGEIEKALTRMEQFIASVRACASVWSPEDVRALPTSSTCETNASIYYEARLRAFTLAAGDSATGARLDARARDGLLHDVVLPYDTLFGQIKDPADNIDGLLGQAHASFNRWLTDSSSLSPSTQTAALAVYTRMLGSIDRMHASLLSQWNDSRYVWLPFRLALRPAEYATQADVDRLIGMAAGQEFTDGNAITYLQSRDLPLEIARSIFAAREYHVLWTHDITSKRHGTHNLDNVGYELIADAYYPALTAAVRRYDQTGRLPVFMILLDEYFYEPRGGRLWMTMLENPLDALTRLPEEDKEREAHLGMRQAELRAAVASSTRLQAEAARMGGHDWLTRMVKVHVNITDPSDFSYRSNKIVPPFTFAPDNLMRDHRKIVLYDLNESDPYRGAMLMMGTGVGEQFASATWEDRGVRVRGPATLEARAALRRVLKANNFRDKDIPVPLRATTVRDTAASNHEYVGRALQVHNEVGWGAKKASVVRAMLYDLAQPGTLIMVPDPQWVNPPWAAMLAGAAARGAKVFVIAPAAHHEPTPDPTLQALVHDVMLRMLDISHEAQPTLTRSGGELRIGLFAAKAHIDDAEGRRAEVRDGVERYPWLRDIFPFDPAAIGKLQSTEEQAATAGNATNIAHDERPRLPMLHQKTQLIARPGAVAALLRQPGWYEALSSVTASQAQETADLTETLRSYQQPAIDTDAVRRTDNLLRGFEQSMSAEERAKVSFYFSVGTMNQDARGMAFDGESSVVTSGFAGAAGLVDLYYLMARSTWVDSKADLERLRPAGNRLRSWLAWLIWPTM